MRLRNPNRKPTHPGATLREDVLPALGMTQTEFAKRLAVSRPTVSELLHEKRGLSADLAIRLGKLTGTTPESWLRMQEALDLWELNRTKAGEYEQIERIAAWFAGTVRNFDGVIIGRANLDGMPLDWLSAPKGPGAPRKDAKRMAIFLAWAIKVSEWKEKFGKADEALVQSRWFKTGISAEEKVRKVRNELARAKGLNLNKDLICIWDSSPENANSPPFAAYLERPTFYRNADGSMDILGEAVGWFPGMGEKVTEPRFIKATIDNFEKERGMDVASAIGGPIILSVYRPGQ